MPTETAIEEASHAVAGELMGVRLERAWASEAAAARVAAQFPGQLVTFGAALFEQSPHNRSVPTINFLVHVAAGAVGRELASRTFRGGTLEPAVIEDVAVSAADRLADSNGPHGADLASYLGALRALVRSSVLSPPFVATMMTTSCAHACRLLAARWNAVHAAAMLMDTGESIDGHTVTRLIRLSDPSYQRPEVVRIGRSPSCWQEAKTRVGRSPVCYSG